jgi:hypothetical protein
VRVGHELRLEPPARALAAELDELAIADPGDRVLTDVGVAAQVLFERLGLPVALRGGLLPRDRELLEAEVLARLTRQQRVGGLWIVGVQRGDVGAQAVGRR